ncbi:hypothetical protein MRX96_013579 [Rhipicephalus microplus]
MMKTLRNVSVMKSAMVHKSVGPPTTKATIRRAPQNQQGDGAQRHYQAQHHEPTDERHDPEHVEHTALEQRTEQVDPPEPVSLGNLAGGTNGASVCFRSATACLRIM